MGIAFVIAIIILIIVFALGLLVFASKRHSSVNQTFAALIFFIGFWLASSLFIDLSPNLTGVYFWAQISLVWAAAIPALWLYFSYIFPVKTPLSRFKKAIILLPPVLFLLFSPTTANIQAIKINPDGSRVIFHGALYFFLFVYFLIFILWAFVRLIKSYRQSQGIVKTQIKYIFIGSLISSLFGLMGAFMFPYLGTEATTNFSSLTVLFFIVFTTYAVLRHHLLEIRVMTAEVFTGLLLLILLANLFTFSTKEQLILNLGLFGSAIIFGIFLVKSVIQEVNARRKVEIMARKIKKANIELRKLDKAKSEFISIASHQLRTPLSAIKGYVSMILDGTYGPLDKRKIEILNRVYVSNERLIGLVNDLLNLSRIEKGKLQFEFRPTDVSEILTSVINEFLVNAQKKGLTINYRAVKLPLVKADAHKLRQVFINILDNAIKYTKKGHIKVQTKVMPRKIIISFSDTGIGMTQDEINSIYKKFRRGRGGKKYHVGGMGIGLYICYKIIEAHHGKLYAKSKGINKGTTFYVELPIK